MFLIKTIGSIVVVIKAIGIVYSSSRSSINMYNTKTIDIFWSSL